jgi:hypothetical protein
MVMQFEFERWIVHLHAIRAQVTHYFPKSVKFCVENGMDVELGKRWALSFVDTFTTYLKRRMSFWYEAPFIFCRLRWGEGEAQATASMMLSKRAEHCSVKLRACNWDAFGYLVHSDSVADLRTVALSGTMPDRLAQKIVNDCGCSLS